MPCDTTPDLQGRIQMVAAIFAYRLPCLGNRLVANLLTVQQIIIFYSLHHLTTGIMHSPQQSLLLYCSSEVNNYDDKETIYIKPIIQKKSVNCQEFESCRVHLKFSSGVAGSSLQCSRSVGSRVVDYL